MSSVKRVNPGLPRPAVAAALAATAVLAAGCAATPTQPAQVGRVISTPSSAPAPLPPARIAEVFVYPSQGQDETQLDRDRYECHRWSVKQSGFDPSLPGLPPQQRVRVVRAGPPPGASVAAGAITGAAFGAAVAEPWNRGEGALIGAAAGAMLGAISESAREEAIAQREATISGYQSDQIAQQEQRADGYRRAITACLEGRGYSVR